MDTALGVSALFLKYSFFFCFVLFCLGVVKTYFDKNVFCVLLSVWFCLVGWGFFNVNKIVSLICCCSSFVLIPNSLTFILSF